jgi:hypothetical protein
LRGREDVPARTQQGVLECMFQVKESNSEATLCKTCKSLEFFSCIWLRYQPRSKMAWLSFRLTASHSEEDLRKLIHTRAHIGKRVVLYRSYVRSKGAASQYSAKLRATKFHILQKCLKQGTSSSGLMKPTFVAPLI